MFFSDTQRAKTTLCVCVSHPLSEGSEAQQGGEGGRQVCVVGVIRGGVQAESLKQSHVLLNPPHGTEQQLLQASHTTKYT